MINLMKQNGLLLKLQFLVRSFRESEAEVIFPTVKAITYRRVM